VEIEDSTSDTLERTVLSLNSEEVRLISLLPQLRLRQFEPAFPYVRYIPDGILILSLNFIFPSLDACFYSVQLTESGLPVTRPLCSWFTTFYNVDKRTDWECLLTLAAAKSAHEPNSHNDLTIWLLERHIQSIASQLPQSFALIRVARGPCL
jgi:hypothetical protein